MTPTPWPALVARFDRDGDGVACDWPPPGGAPAPGRTDSGLRTHNRVAGRLCAQNR